VKISKKQNNYNQT